MGSNSTGLLHYFFYFVNWFFIVFWACAQAWYSLFVSPLRNPVISTKAHTNQGWRNEIRLFFHLWSIFPHYLICCGLQGNKAQCDPCDSVVVAQICALLLTSSELVWGWMMSNPLDVCVCPCVCVWRQKGSAVSGYKGESLEILRKWGYPHCKGDTWSYQSHWLETRPRKSTNG